MIFAVFSFLCANFIFPWLYWELLIVCELFITPSWIISTGVKSFLIYFPQTFPLGSTFGTCWSLIPALFSQWHWKREHIPILLILCKNKNETLTVNIWTIHWWHPWCLCFPCIEQSGSSFPEILAKNVFSDLKNKKFKCHIYHSK